MPGSRSSPSGAAAHRSPHRAAHRAPRRPGSRLLVVGVALFLGGVALIAVTVLPYATGHHDRPLGLNAAAGLAAPVGLGLALTALLLGARADRRAQPPAAVPGAVGGAGGPAVAGHRRADGPATGAPADSGPTTAAGAPAAR